MDDHTINVLLVEDSPTDALLVREELAHATGATFVVTHAEELRVALERLAKEHFDVVLSDLGLPDSDGLETFEQLHNAKPGVPIIILSGRNDERMAIEAVHAGAQDYLVKGHGDESGLARAIRYAIERARAKETIAAHARQQQAVAALGQRALAGVEIDTLFTISVALVADTLGIECCGVFEALPGDEELFLRAGVGWNDGVVGATTMPTANVLPAKLGSAESLHPFVLENDGRADARFSTVPLLREHGVVTSVTVLIRGRHKPWGALGAHTTRVRKFTPHEVTFLQTIAHVLGEAIERKGAEEALHESDARFHQVVENIHEALWIFEPATNRIVYVSPRYAEIWGCSDATLRKSPRAWMERVHPDDAERVQSALPAMDRGRGHAETFRIVRPDGAVRWIRHRTFAARDQSGHVRRLIAVAEDTTEQKKLEEQFLRSQRLEAIGTLASGVAHDLNNILAPVLMTAELLTVRAAPGRDRELLTMMAQGAQRAADTVRQLLMFSRGVQGQRGLVQIRHLMKEMVSIMKETFPRDIVIVETPASDLWPVLADATQLHQVMMNLCVNARDAMPNGGTLTLGALKVELGPDDLEVHVDARPGRYTVIVVADTGHGIPPEIINRIFDPFFTTKELGKGSGLGLSTVVGILRSHGGFITVDSEPGRGTVFKGYLPAASDNALSALKTAAPAPMGHGELVLVVDDETAIREATREILEQNQYRVLTAADGREAIDVYQKERDNVRLVITDVMMPVMSGAALVRALRAIEPNLKIIACSGLDQEGKRAELAALGVAEVIMKPFVAAQLLGVLRRHLSAGQSATPWRRPE